jgi:hypothetical protein
MIEIEIEKGPPIRSGERGADLHEVSGKTPEWGTPQATNAKVIQGDRSIYALQDDCVLQAHSRGWCTTHYRRWRSGQPMDAPIRGYVRYEEDSDSNCKPSGATRVRPKRERPFAAEYALLAELGIRRD